MKGLEVEIQEEGLMINRAVATIYSIIDNKKEIEFLDYISMRVLNEKADQDTFDYSLDKYNFYKVIEEDNRLVKFKSLIDSVKYICKKNE